MKNLRKVLALVLVVASVMSFTAMASAATYVDDAKINNDVAVEVLAALGVMNGKPAGNDKFNFDPQGIITRAELAKMITVVLNGAAEAEEINKAYAAACDFTDVKDGHWAEGYIAYCNAEGIIAGNGAGKFFPDANVTVMQAAKMILVAMGYDAKIAGLEGDLWAANVAKYAKKANLYKGVSQLATANATRESAAQLVFNGLMTKMVEVDDEGFPLPDGKGGYMWVGVTYKEAAKTLAETYFNGLNKDVDTTVAFGVPAVQYTYAGKTLTIPATAVLEGTNAVTAATIAKLSGTVALDASNVTVYVDGAINTDIRNAIVAAYNETKKAAKDQVAATLNAPVGGKGVALEVYFDGANMVVVLKNTYVATSVKDTFNATAKTAKIQLMNTSGVANQKTIKTETNLGNAIVYYNYNALGATEAEQYVNVAVAKFITDSGKITDADADNALNVKAVTVNGTKYALNANAKGYGYANADATSASYMDMTTALKVAKNFKNTYKIWADAEGNILYWSLNLGSTPAAAAKTNAILVKDVEYKADAFAETYRAVQLINLNTFKVETKYTLATAIGAVPGDLVTFAVNAKDATKFDIAKVASPVTNAANDVDAKTATVTDGTNTYYADDTTNFILGTTKDGVVTYKAGFTGIAKAADYKAIKTIIVEGKPGEVAKNVILIDAEVKEADPTTVKKLTLVYKTEAETPVVTNGVWTYTVDAIVDGVKATLEVSTTAYGALVKGLNYVESYTVKDGVVDTVDLDLNETDAQTAVVAAAWKNGLIDLKLDGAADATKYYLTNAVKAYLYKTDAKTLAISDVTALTTNFSGYAVLVDGSIVAFYGTDK